MRINKHKLILSIFMVLFSINFIASIDTFEYEYVSKIKVNCEEYKGYARFEIPQEYNSFENPKSYMDIENFIDKTYNQKHYAMLDNWFVKQIDGQSTSEVEKIFDNNYGSYLVDENKNQIDFIFESPVSLEVDKVSIDLRDSLIDGLKIYDKFGEEVDFRLNSKEFHYEVLFDSSVHTNYLRFVINYKDILKIKEVVFFNLKNYDEKSYGYIYVDDDCLKEHMFYFGKYGESNSRSGSKSLPVEFYVGVETFRNSLYDNDFDNDSILNEEDNCPYVSNENQKDINYNSVGDACEDDDNDGVVNSVDNCVDKYNKNQLDNDNDGIGNVCDEDDGRFFEKNKYLIFIFAGIIAVIFLVVAIIIMRN